MSKKMSEKRESDYEYQKGLIKKIINPETGKFFKSPYEYQKYLVKKQFNPETGELFKSVYEYKKYLSERRRKKTKTLTTMPLNGLELKLDSN